VPKGNQLDLFNRCQGDKVEERVGALLANDYYLSPIVLLPNVLDSVSLSISAIVCKSKSQSLQGGNPKDKPSPTSTSTPTLATTRTNDAVSDLAYTGTGSTTASCTPSSTLTGETDVLFDVSTVRPITAITVGYKLCEPFKQL
jgi:hypothetical protein